MKILNLHGFLGKADNRNYQALRDLLPDAEISAPKLDFLHTSPEVILSQLCQIVDDEHIDLVVGQSLGAAFGLTIAKQYGVPCILTNPCLEPAKTEIIVNSELSPEQLKNYEKIDFRQSYDKAYILLSDHDEIIRGNREICQALTPHWKMTSGTHSRLDHLKEELAQLLNELGMQ